MKRPHAGFARLRAAIDLRDTALMAVGGLMLMLMLLVVADVALHCLFNAPQYQSYEVVSNFLMPGLFFLAVSHTLGVHGRHGDERSRERMGRQPRQARVLRQRGARRLQSRVEVSAAHRLLLRMPPSTTTVAPFMKREASLASSSRAPSRSVGSPARRAGVCAIRLWAKP